MNQDQSEQRLRESLVGKLPFEFLVSKPENKPGVYAIVNFENLKFYIGSSKTVADRLSYQFKLLNRNKSTSLFLQRSFKKCPGFFVGVAILYENNHFDFEQKFLDKLHDNQKECYNLSTTAKIPTMTIAGKQSLIAKNKQWHKLHPEISQNLTKYAQSEQGRKKSSETLKKTYQNPEFRENLKRILSEKGKKFHNVCLLDPNGNLVLIGWNLKEFAIKNGLFPSNLHRLIAGGSKSCKGWKLVK